MSRRSQITARSSGGPLATIVAVAAAALCSLPATATATTESGGDARLVTAVRGDVTVTWRATVHDDHVRFRLYRWSAAGIGEIVWESAAERGFREYRVADCLDTHDIVVYRLFAVLGGGEHPIGTLVRLDPIAHGDDAGLAAPHPTWAVVTDVGPHHDGEIRAVATGGARPDDGGRRPAPDPPVPRESAGGALT